MTGYTLLRGGSRDGPFSEEQLSELLESGRIDPATLCLEDGDPTPFFVSELFEEADEPSSQKKNRPRLRLVAHPSILCHAPLLIFGLVSAFAGWYFSAKSPWIGFAGIATFSLLFAYAVFDRTCHEYLVTDKRVEHLSGWFFKSSREARISDIRAINVTKSGALGLLGCGTVEFATAGTDGVDVTFTHVWRPDRIKRLVRQLQDA